MREPQDTAAFLRSMAAWYRERNGLDEDAPLRVSTSRYPLPEGISEGEAVGRARRGPQHHE